MLVKLPEPTKREYCIAVYNKHLHRRSICPGNHHIDYSNGWFYFDDEKPFQDPEFTAEADEAMNDPMLNVGYSRVWNTFVLFYES